MPCVSAASTEIPISRTRLSEMWMTPARTSLLIALPSTILYTDPASAPPAGMICPPSPALCRCPFRPGCYLARSRSIGYTCSSQFHRLLLPVKCPLDTSTALRLPQTVRPSLQFVHRPLDDLALCVHLVLPARLC